MLVALPVIYLAALFSLINYNFSIVGAHLLVSFAVLIYVGVRNQYLRYGLGMALIFLMYWTANTIFYVGVALFIMHELCCKRQKYFVAISTMYLLISIPIPVLTHDMLSLPFEECFFSGYWIMETLITDKDVELIYPSLAIFPMVCLFVYLGSIISNKRLVCFGAIVRPLLLAVMLIGLFAGCIRVQETKVLKSLYLLRNEKWQEMINRVQQTEKPIFSEMALYNFALAKEPDLSRQLLFDSRNSINYYQLDQMKGMLKLCFSAELYFHLGFVNKSFYDYFNVSKSLDRHGSAYCVSRMAYIAMVKGNYPLARKYYAILSETWLYARQAKEYMQLLSDPTRIEQHESIQEKRKLLLHDNSFFWSDQFLSNLVMYVDTGTENRLASEYLAGFILLAKDLTRLTTYIEPLILLHYNGSDVPDIYQQAILCYYVETTDPALEKLRVGDKNKQLFESFKKDITAENVLKKYEGTYFYYLLKR